MYIPSLTTIVWDFFLYYKFLTPKNPWAHTALELHRAPNAPLSANPGTPLQTNTHNLRNSRIYSAPKNIPKKTSIHYFEKILNPLILDVKNRLD